MVTIITIRGIDFTETLYFYGHFFRFYKDSEDGVCNFMALRRFWRRECAILWELFAKSTTVRRCNS